MKRVFWVPISVATFASIIWYASLDTPQPSVAGETQLSLDSGGPAKGHAGAASGAAPANPVAVERPSSVQILKIEPEKLTPELVQRDHDLLALGSADLEAALRFIKEKYPPGSQQSALRFLMGELGGRDLNVVLRLYGEFTDKGARQVGLGMAATAWLKKDPGALMRFINEQTSGVMKNEILLQTVGVCANGREWELGQQFFEQMPFSALRTSALTNFSALYGVADPVKAASWAASLPLRDERAAAERNIVVGLQASGNVQGLQQIVANMSPEGRGSAKELIGRLAMERGVPIQQLLAEQKGTVGSPAPVLIGAIGAASKDQLSSIIPIAHPLGDATDRNRVLGGIAERLFVLNQPEGVQFAMSLKGNERDAAIRGVVNKWYFTDSEQLSEWANSLPRGNDQDIALETMARHLRGTDKELAKKVAASISNESRRKSLLRSMP